MKDKLYKLHRGHKYYIFRRIFVGAALLISSSILVAISLSISLSNDEIKPLQSSSKEPTNNDSTKDNFENTELLAYED